MLMPMPVERIVPVWRVMHHAKFQSVPVDHIEASADDSIKPGKEARSR